jgi:hypothetical protein
VSVNTSGWRALSLKKNPFAMNLRIPSMHLYGGPQYGTNQTPVFIEWEKKTPFQCSIGQSSYASKAVDILKESSLRP